MQHEVLLPLACAECPCAGAGSSRGAAQEVSVRRDQGLPVLDRTAPAEELLLLRAEPTSSAGAVSVTADLGKSKNSAWQMGESFP